MNNNRLIVTILVLVIILIGIGWFLSAKGLLPWSNSSAGNGAGTVVSKPTDWQAIFLSNGQVYFGKMESSDSGQYLVLSDIFYLQLAKAPQPDSAKTTDEAQQQVSLVKLGSELHGPVDKMRINRDHVIFIEQMKSDAKVVTAIEQFKKNGPAPAPSGTIETTPSPKK